MTTKKEQKIQALSQAIESQAKDAGISLKGLLEKLPNWALLPVTVGLFALLLTDTAIADPLPFVDEAALFYAFINSLRVLGGRRKAKRLAAQLEAESLEDDDIIIDVDEPRLRDISAPGQPLYSRL